MTDPDREYSCFYDPQISSWYIPRFQAGIIEVSSGDIDGVIPALREIERWTMSGGGCAVGYISYQASPAFDTALQVPGRAVMPLLSFRLYKELRIDFPLYLHQTDDPQMIIQGTQERMLWDGPSKEQYAEGFGTVKEALRAGDTYQVNYTAPFTSTMSPGALRLLTARLARPAGYFARYSSLEYELFSYSPELFFRKTGRSLSSLPMKGTAPRDFDPVKDAENRSWLENSVKNRAENLMIVDMIRNDLGRIAQPGTVTAEKLFSVETYPYVHQMVSRVCAQTGASLTDVLTALFPCASITGAPKVKTMEIISKIEPDPREVYTGSLGIVLPGGDALFNVAIRTLWFKKQIRSARITYGAGGGIVWDSSFEEEWNELHLKMGAVV